MKYKNSRYPIVFRLILAVVFVLPALISKAQVDSYIGSYSGSNKNGYIQPIASVLTSAFNTGQVMHTRIDTNFRVYFHIIGTASFILSDKLKYFDATTPQGFLPVQIVSAPTLLGPRASKTVAGINGTAATFPAGFGVEYLTLAVPQLALAWSGTELVARFFAYDTKDDLGKINLWGGGLRHDIGRYFLSDTSWHLSVGGMYQKVKVGNYLDLGTFNGSVTFGQQNKRWHYFAIAGYQSGNLKGGYKHYNGETFDQVNFDLKSDNPLFFGLGIGLSLGFLQLQLQATGYEPVIGSFALGFKF
ncbi:MAG: DUF6588 family protein [Saprospiraceae bacterium]|nr:DUF6588 family protein [Saprospiraceae bacterium]